MDTYQKHFFLPTNICNNKEYIEQNKKIFKRSFESGDNLEENKILEKHQYLSSRPQATGPCLPKRSTKCPPKNYCSSYSKVVNQESDIYRLYNYDTKCSQHKMKLKYVDNPSSLPNSEQNLKSPPPLVGIINPYCNLKQNSVFSVHPHCHQNSVQECNDGNRFPGCHFENYLQGPNSASSQTDVTAYLKGESICQYQQDNWNNYSKFSNMSSDITSQAIKNEIINFQYPESNPFRLEDTRVLKKPDRNIQTYPNSFTNTSIQPCQNLFNNMTKRKSLVHYN